MKQSFVPTKVLVRLNTKGKKVLWNDHPVMLCNFVTIRKYIDACLDRIYESEFHHETLTNNANLLILLVEELEKKIPECTEEQIKKWQEKKDGKIKDNGSVDDRHSENEKVSINKLGDYFPPKILKKFEKPEIDVEDIQSKRKILSRLKRDINLGNCQASCRLGKHKNS